MNNKVSEMNQISDKNINLILNGIENWRMELTAGGKNPEVSGW